MEVHVYIPHPALKDYILTISTVHFVLPEGNREVVTPYPPTPFQSILFYCSHPISMSRTAEDCFHLQPSTVVVGPQFSRVNIMVHRQLSAIRVDFLPGGLFRMLGIPMQELFDGGFDAQELFGKEIREINDYLQNITTLEEGKNLVEGFLLRHVKDLKERLPVDAALGKLLDHHGCLPMEETASLACLSLKQFERKCRERIGMNPKLYSRILKFSKAYRLYEAFPQLSWTQIAQEAGYYDQMHMIRDFKVFAGVNPTIIGQQLSTTPLRMQKDLRC